MCKRTKEKTVSCKCELKNCALWGDGVCVSQNTIPCKSMPEQFLDYSASAHNSDYAKLYKEHNFRYCPYCGSSLSESYKCGCCNFA